ncbi:hypothetical protein IV203_016216 [Nitzschia inconspicua]|uniref:PDZ domain-containing protein n=1 Tax=Nitzschia inconspicua TaxID=303405 RepID=A0A9K3KQ79_9STRA|nr:hypothetical protein IV203_016216 [Nitzschia inconspicua]
MNNNSSQRNNQRDEESALRKVLASLDVQRKAMENEADAIYLELSTPPEEGIEPMGVDTPLVDADGYPRGDIDVYRARTLRNRFRILQTDHKEITQKIEGLLVQLAALKDPSKKLAEEAERAKRLAPKPKPKYDAKTGKWVVMNWDGSVAGIEGGNQIQFKDLSRAVSGLTEPTMDSDRSSLYGADGANGPSSPREEARLVQVDAAPLRPFARVNAVAADSPAEITGLKEDDLIVRFGNVDADNHNNLRAIADLVPMVAGEGGDVEIVVLRRPAEYEEHANQDASNVTTGGSTPEYDDPTKWQKLSVSLSPRPWSGRGLIGCHIVPYHA